MRLFGAETRRLGARRAVRWLSIVAVLVIALGAGLTAAHSRYRTAQFTGQTCTDKNGVVECRNEVAGERIDQRYNLEHSLGNSLDGTGVALLLLAVIFGATFIGGDYVGGSLAGQLTFEPRRRYVYAVKALAAAVVTALVVAGLLAVVAGSLALVAQTRGVVGHLDGTWFSRRLGDVARISAVSGLASAMAFAFTSVARRTVAAVVGFLGLAFIVEPALTHAWRVFYGRTPVFALLSTTANHFGGGDSLAGYRSLGRSVFVLGVWAVVLLLACGAVFARREVR